MTRPEYPLARRDDTADDYHGELVADPYRWLEDADSAETRAWIEAQNRLAESWLAGVAARGAIRRRLRELTDHPRSGVPWHRADRWFVLRNSGLENQDVLWTMSAPDDRGEVLIDPNLLSDDGTVALSGVSVSPDGALVAYALSEAGSDWLTWQVRDVASGKEIGDLVRWAKFSGAAWAPDASGFWYARYDEPPADAAYEAVNRDQQLWFHRLGTPQEHDDLVHAREDHPEWGFSPQTTDDGRYVVITVWEGTHPYNGVALIDLAGDRSNVTMLLDDFDAAYDFAGNDGSTLYFRTDLDAPLGRIIAVDAERPSRDGWREAVRETDDSLERARIIGDRLLAVYLHHASHKLRWFTLDGVPDGEIPVPAGSSVDAVTGRRGDRLACYSVMTFTHPASVFSYDIDTGETAPLHIPDVTGEDVVTEQHFVTSTDGERVPVFLVHRADVTADASAAVWLYGYGGFQIALTPTFKPEWLAWIERGGVVAVANLRGGGEYGQAWHDAGRLGNKQQVFDDALAVTQWLHDSGWARPGRVAIHGRSNGGLLAAACLVQRPDMLGAAVVEVGVLDMLRFHRFTIGWGWVSDYGSADDPEQYRWLRAYSPLHNIQPGRAYPPTLITTGDHDDRVVPGHSFKFAAALQAAQGDDAPVLIRIDTQAGHGAGKPTDKIIEERADVVAFLVRALQLQR